MSVLTGLLLSSVLAAQPPGSHHWAQPVALQTPATPGVHTASGTPLTIETGAGKVITFGAPATNVFVGDPKVAEVRPASANALFVFGVSPGRTTVAALDADGKPVAQYEITVRTSGFAASEAESAVARLVPGSRIHVQPGPKGLMLSGDAGSPVDAARALSIARSYLAEGQAVEDQISVASSVQISLRVRIAEMSRSVTRSLGVNWQELGTLGAAATVNSFTLGAAAGMLKIGSADINAVVDALAQDNLAKVLAEPTLTAMSGQSASFLAGGEFPIPVAQQNNVTTIEFKKYGVNLTFVPTVLSSGRINLRVSPEVSEITQNGAFQLNSSNSSISVPALTVRRAETSVELGSGQSFAIAGLLQDNATQVSHGLPFLGDIPVLGALFKSSEFQRQETELVILITPFVVKPVDDAAKLHTPGENYQAPNDLERILRGRQIARGTPVIPVRLPANAGFIVQ